MLYKYNIKLVINYNLFIYLFNKYTIKNIIKL